MVVSSQVVVTVANVSANLCQFIACNPERLSNDEVLDLIFCFPFQQFRRLSLCLWTFFCFPVGDPFSVFSPSSSSSSSASSSDAEDLHSD